MVRLPVAHCALNPIELAWAQVKGHIKANIHTFNLRQVEQLAWEDFDVVIPDRWKSLIQHVNIHFEDHYWSNDGLYEELVDMFITRVEMNWMSVMIWINLIVLMTISSRHSQSSFFVKRFFKTMVAL